MSGRRAAPPSIRRPAPAKFALVGLGPASLIGAAVGVGSLYLAGYADAANAAALAVTWWLRDAAGILVVAPVVVLWALTTFRRFNLDKVLASAIALVAATLVGLVAFSPLVEQSANRARWASSPSCRSCGPRCAAARAMPRRPR